MNINISLANTAHFGTHIYKENNRMAIDFFDSHSGASCCFKHGAQTNLRTKPKNMHPRDQKKYCTKNYSKFRNKSYHQWPYQTKQIQAIISKTNEKIWASDTEQNVILHKPIRDTITTPEDHRNWMKDSINWRHLRMATTVINNVVRWALDRVRITSWYSM